MAVLAVGCTAVGCTALAMVASIASAQPLGLPADTVAARSARAAHHAVESFERRRRFLLPVARGDPGRCDVRMGRYCYWYDEVVGAGPEEPARIGEARHRLLSVLDSLAALRPEDAWLAGQRVLYRLDDHDLAGARRAALDCAADRWWCAALAGLALHRSDYPAAADSAFTVALAAMPAGLACQWRDIGVLLDDTARRRYRSLSCPQRETIERRFWWLASPLWSRPGNDARSEHLSRAVLGVLAEQGATPYGGRWGADMNELLLRYGWPIRWGRREPGAAGPGEVAIIGYDASPSYHWPADARLLDTPYDARPGDWTPRDPHARSRDAPLHARRLHDLEAVMALLRRGDSLLALAAVPAPQELAGRATSGAEAALVLALDTAALATVRTPFAGRTLLLEAVAPDRPLLASIELAADSGEAARLRLAVRPPPLESGFGLSDLLLYSPASDADTTMDAARRAPVARTVPRSSPLLGIYWELYGLGDGAVAVSTELTVLGERPGWLERAWRTARGARRPEPVRMRWTDVASGRGMRGRTVLLALGSLAPGSYTVELRATTPDGRTATVRRDLRLTPE